MQPISETLAIAVAHHQAGRLAEAEQIYRRILAAEPGCAQAWHLLGVIAYQAGRFGAAIELSERALELTPEYAEAHYNLGLALEAQDKVREAGERFRKALQLRPDFVEARVNLGNVLKDQERFEEAVECFRRALELWPDNHLALNSLGLALKEQGKLDEAIACFGQVLTLSPSFAEAHGNLGLAFYEDGKLAEAAECYATALELKPDFAAAHCNLAHLMLLKGDFENGWLEYEWRKKLRKHSPRDFGQPNWDGEPLGGKTILLHSEQGLGDTIQFVRYALMVKLRGGTVVLDCQKRLNQLLAGIRVDYLVKGGDLPPFDVHAPLLSLPAIFKTTLETIPTSVPYLQADTGLVEQWREQLSDVRGFRVGINWHGREGLGAFRLRDIPLEHFAPLAHLPGVQLVNLQKDGSRELARVSFAIFDPGEDVDTVRGAFVDTAAIMKNVDLVITSDTAVAHLAGALGVPVWVALPFVPNWRWLLDRSDTPWYPTMRLFRQRRPGDWKAVFAEICDALGFIRGTGVL